MMMIIIISCFLCCLQSPSPTGLKHIHWSNQHLLNLHENHLFHFHPQNYFLCCDISTRCSKLADVNKTKPTTTKADNISLISTLNTYILYHLALVHTKPNQSVISEPNEENQSTDPEPTKPNLPKPSPSPPFPCCRTATADEGAATTGSASPHDGPPSTPNPFLVAACSS